MKYKAYEIHPVVAMDLSGRPATDRTPPDEVVWEMVGRGDLYDPNVLRGWSIYGVTPDGVREEVSGPYSTAVAAHADAVKQGYIPRKKKSSMNYTVQFGFGCYATFSSMEKAALAMRCIAEADVCIREREVDDGEKPTIRMFPEWPKVEVPEQEKPQPEPVCREAGLADAARAHVTPLSHKQF